MHFTVSMSQVNKWSLFLAPGKLYQRNSPPLVPGIHKALPFREELESQKLFANIAQCQQTQVAHSSFSASTCLSSKLLARTL